MNPLLSFVFRVFLTKTQNLFKGYGNVCVYMYYHVRGAFWSH